MSSALLLPLPGEGWDGGTRPRTLRGGEGRLPPPLPSPEGREKDNTSRRFMASALLLLPGKAGMGHAALNTARR
ncbi:hypothetical protein GFK26_01555 [Variovorax paradoxus]|uniref:Uncharacterized protein n=1 Tax=Variovorax paradoxus TaxID=34073 RepID=A0A5Q0LWJ0_VARPD|nr:hypothetical protein GFK26_01555 [Variovorax paradoxus]